MIKGRYLYRVQSTEHFLSFFFIEWKEKEGRGESVREARETDRPRREGQLLIGREDTPRVTNRDASHTEVNIQQERKRVKQKQK